jgi:hypothetical protein
MTETLVQMYERLQIKPRTEQRREAQTKRIVAIARHKGLSRKEIAELARQASAATYERETRLLRDAYRNAYRNAVFPQRQRPAPTQTPRPLKTGDIEALVEDDWSRRALQAQVQTQQALERYEAHKAKRERRAIQRKRDARGRL